jgi:hypothetical protein
MTSVAAPADAAGGEGRRKKRAATVECITIAVGGSSAPPAVPEPPANADGACAAHHPACPHAYDGARRRALTHGGGAERADQRRPLSLSDHLREMLGTKITT